MVETTSAAQDNAVIVRRFYDEVVNQGDLAALADLAAPGFVEHTALAFPGHPHTGPAAIEWFVTGFRTAFPDLRATVEDLVVSGDKVAARVTWTGTHTGRFLGIDPTGKRIRVSGLDLARLAGGKLTEHWGLVDVLEIARQLGFLPQPDDAMAY